MQAPTSPAARIAAALALLGALPAAATAQQDYPSKPIRLIVGFAAGGIADLLARAVGTKLTEAWGQQVIIDNRTGAGGVVSMTITAKAPPDGYTLLLCSNGPMVISSALQPSLPYNPLRDYRAVTQAALTPVILTVHPTHPARSLQELIQLARAKPGGMNYGSTGHGAMPHIAAEVMKRVAGVDITHIPYKGGSEAVTAVMGGHVQMSFGAVSTSLPHLRAGRMRALGVTGLARVSATPDVPTFAESGMPGFDVVQWFGVFGPSGMPPAVVNKLHGTLAKALGAPEFREQFASQGIELMSTTPDAFAAFVRAEIPRWTRVLREMGIREAP